MSSKSPGGKGTTKVTGFSGYSARATDEASSVALDTLSAKAIDKSLFI
jgi:hypothetical protein